MPIHDGADHPIKARGSGQRIAARIAETRFLRSRETSFSVAQRASASFSMQASEKLHAVSRIGNLCFLEKSFVDPDQP